MHKHCKVLKKNLHTHRFDNDKVRSRLKYLSWNLKISFDKILEQINVHLNGVNLIKSEQIDNILILVIKNVNSEDLNYTKLATRLQVSQLHNIVPKSFLLCIQRLFKNNVIQPSTYKFIIDHYSEINAAIVYFRDFNIIGSQLNNLIQHVLTKQNNLIIERPQHYFMRISVEKVLNSESVNIKNCISQYDLITI